MQNSATSWGLHDWRDLQRIKNELIGRDREAVELYPAEARLVDTSNQYHLFVLPADASWPFGYGERDVSEGGAMGANRQRPFEVLPADVGERRESGKLTIKVLAPFVY